jgi:fatty acid-binding protein DegV
MLAKSECYFIAKDINGLATTNNVKTKNNIFIKSRLDFKILLECDKVSGGKLKEITSMKGDRKIIESMLELALCNIEPTEYHFYIGHYGDIEMAKVCEDLLLLKYPRADYSHIALNDSIGAFIQSNSLCFFTIRK